MQEEKKKVIRIYGQVQNIMRVLYVTFFNIVERQSAKVMRAFRRLNECFGNLLLQVGRKDFEIVVITSPWHDFLWPAEKFL